MSLVVAFRLVGGDVLFGADKRIVHKSETGTVARITADAHKLFWDQQRGIIGMAGQIQASKPVLDRALSSQPTSCKDMENALTRAYHEAGLNGDDMEFLMFIENGFYAFRSPAFVPQFQTDNFGASGAVGLAHLLCGLYWPAADFTIAHAQRLAALQIMQTSEADPTNVSKEMVIWLARKGSAQPEACDVGPICEWVEKFRERSARDLSKG